MIILDAVTSIIFIETFLILRNKREDKICSDGQHSTDLKAYYISSRISISPPSSAQIEHL